MNPDEIMRMLQELTVYKIELELQNEQLSRSQEELEAALARYTDLYVFSPVAYFTVNNNGLISETNLVGAELVGAKRSEVSGKSFVTFLNQQDQTIFQGFLVNVFTSGTKQTCGVSLAGSNDQPVQVIGKLAPGGHHADLVVMEPASLLT
jgi:PAS domain-containing protein